MILKSFPDSILNSVQCNKADIERYIIKIDWTKAIGPDGIENHILKKIAEKLSESIELIFSLKGHTRVFGRLAKSVPFLKETKLI